jgi:hypothetical protein
VIGFGPNVIGVIGAEVPSRWPAGGRRQFVTPKKNSEIPAETVALKAEVTSSSGKLFDDLYYWEVNGDGVHRAGEILELSRGTPGRFRVTIHSQADDTVQDWMYVWIIWADRVIPKCQNGIGKPQSNSEAMASGWGIDPDNRWRFVFVIQPISLFTDSPDFDTPKLNGNSNAPTPGVSKTYPVHTEWGDGDTALLRFDVSRMMNISLRNPALMRYSDFSDSDSAWITKLPSEVDDVLVPWPTPPSFGPDSDAEGNDDPVVPTRFGGEDEDDNPYRKNESPLLAHDIGEVSSWDGPMKMIKDSAGVLNREFEYLSNFKEFVRVDISSALSSHSQRFWFRISEYTEWYFQAKLKGAILPTKATQFWIDSGSRTNYGNIKPEN